MDRAKTNLGQLEGETVRQTIPQSKVESDEQSVSMGNLLLRQIYTQLAMHGRQMKPSQRSAEIAYDNS